MYHNLAMHLKHKILIHKVTAFFINNTINLYIRGCEKTLPHIKFQFSNEKVLKMLGFTFLGSITLGRGLVTSLKLVISLLRTFLREAILYEMKTISLERLVGSFSTQRQTDIQKCFQHKTHNYSLLFFFFKSNGIYLVIITQSSLFYCFHFFGI